MSLSTALETDLDWREAELASLKILAVTSPAGSVRRQALLRSLLALLYAHYEGFCKYSWSIFLDYIEDQSIELNSLQGPLAALASIKELRRVKNLGSEETLSFFQTELTEFLHAPAVFSHRPSANSNLWPELLAEHLKSLCLNPDHVINHKILLRSLVARRNAVAHGDSITISDVSEYINIENAVVEVMYNISFDIIDVIESQSYLNS